MGTRLRISLYRTCIILITIIHVFILAGSELRELSEECTCLGYTKIYECAVVGDAIGTTVWQGTAFNCEVGMVINLVHDRFTSAAGAFGSCNDQAIVARSLRVENNRYISQLRVIVSDNLIGKSIKCANDDGVTTTTVGTKLITLTTGKQNLHVVHVHEYTD